MWFLPKWFNLEQAIVNVTEVTCPVIEVEIEQFDVAISIDEIEIAVEIE